MVVIFVLQIIFTAYLRLTCPCHLWPFCQGDNQTKRVAFDSLRFGHFRMLIFQFIFASLTWFLYVQPFHFPIKPCPPQYGALVLSKMRQLVPHISIPQQLIKKMADLQKEEEETSNSNSGDGWVLMPFFPDSKRSDRALERLWSFSTDNFYPRFQSVKAYGGKIKDMKYFNIRALKLLRYVSNKQSKQEARIKANGLGSHGLESFRSVPNTGLWQGFMDQCGKPLIKRVSQEIEEPRPCSISCP